MKKVTENGGNSKEETKSTYTILSKISKSIIDDMQSNIFKIGHSKQIKDLLDNNIEKIENNLHSFLQNSCKKVLTLAEHKQNLDSKKQGKEERMKKIETLINIKSKFSF